MNIAIQKNQDSEWCFRNSEDKALLQELKIFLPGKLRIREDEMVHEGCARFKIKKDHSDCDSVFLKNLFDYGIECIWEVDNCRESMLVRVFGYQNIVKILGLIAEKNGLFVSFSSLNVVLSEMMKIKMPRFEESSGFVLPSRRTELGNLVCLGLGFLSREKKGLEFGYRMNDSKHQDILTKELEKIPGVRSNMPQDSYGMRSILLFGDGCEVVSPTDDKEFFIVEKRRMLIESVEEVLELIDKYLPLGEEYWGYLKDGISYFSRGKKILHWNVATSHSDLKGKKLRMWTCKESSLIQEVVIGAAGCCSDSWISFGKQHVTLSKLMEEFKGCYYTLLGDSNRHNTFDLYFDKHDKMLEILEKINLNDPLGEEVMFELREGFKKKELSLN